MCLVLRGKGGNKEVCDRGIQYQCLNNRGIVELVCILMANNAKSWYKKRNNMKNLPQHMTSIVE